MTNIIVFEKKTIMSQAKARRWDMQLVHHNDPDGVQS